VPVAVTVDALLVALWRDYVASTPQAERIHALLAARGETIRNDHIALRGIAPVTIDALAQPFQALGWQPRERYRFADKHLVARYWQHPDAALPKVFISELVVDELPAAARAILERLTDQLPDGFAARADLPYAGRPWQVSHVDYCALLGDSEYAAWLAAFGFRVNHFTVDVGALRTFPNLSALVEFVRGHGFAINDSGGAIKGSPREHLEQASTRADAIDVAVAERSARVPSCYYEFALRHRLPSGELFHGFVPSSADKIFESTDVRAT
jgi:hypothetical protein